MTSYSARYAAGEHEAVWREMDRAWAEFAETVTANGPWLRHYVVDRDDAEDVMRQTFKRVARNTDRLIDALRDTGYRFECEAGRHSDPVPPRRSAASALASIQQELEGQFGDLQPYGQGLPPLPPAIWAFGEIVGSVDLRQRYPGHPEAPESLKKLREGSQSESGIFDPELQKGALQLLEAMQSFLPEPTPAELEGKRRIEASDRLPHPHAGDPVLARLGDWDPVCFDFDGIEFELTKGDREPWIQGDGGVVWQVEFAPGFEHKANVSGAENYALRLPIVALDPAIYAEGIAIPFTTYLRRCFARGGFFGTPRPFFRKLDADGLVTGYLEQPDWPPVREVEPGFWLPDHPVFASLAQSFERF